jgi:small subunit ribosomal protein S4
MTDKCGFERRAYPPGQHGMGRIKFSEYGLQLREKQKIKRMYGLVEKQFKNIFFKAERMKGVTGTNLLVMLERRLDNVAYRTGFANSRSEARHLATHGHFLVNGKRVNIPSYLLKKGDVLEICNSSRSTLPILNALEGVKRREIPQWLELDSASFKSKIRDLPSRDDMTAPMEERMVVELYSK